MPRILGLSKACPTRSCRSRDPEPHASESQSSHYPPLQKRMSQALNTAIEAQKPCSDVEPHRKNHH